MKKIIWLGIVFLIFLTGCSSPNTKRTLVEISPSEFSDTLTPTLITSATRVIPTIPSNEDYSEPNLADNLRAMFEYYINLPDYDPTKSVVHKYFERIEFVIENDQLYMILDEDIDSSDDISKFATECMILASAVGGLDNVKIDSIELVYPSIANWDYRYVIDGTENIKSVYENFNAITEVMKLELSPAIITMMTQIAKASQDPTQVPPTKTVTYPTNTFVPSTALPPQLNECKTYSSGTVKCRIEHAYCSYIPSVSGQPTFCNDAPDMNHSFTYVVWGQDVSHLNGHCIIVYGKIEYYNGKPEITWQSNDGFDGYCD